MLHHGKGCGAEVWRGNTKGTTAQNTNNLKVSFCTSGAITARWYGEVCFVVLEY